jgi:hypothetical protein
MNISYGKKTRIMAEFHYPLLIEFAAGDATFERSSANLVGLAIDAPRSTRLRVPRVARSPPTISLFCSAKFYFVKTEPEQYPSLGVIRHARYKYTWIIVFVST